MEWTFRRLAPLFVPLSSIGREVVVSRFRRQVEVAGLRIGYMLPFRTGKNVLFCQGRRHGSSAISIRPLDSEEQFSVFDRAYNGPKIVGSFKDPNSNVGRRTGDADGSGNR